MPVGVWGWDNRVSGKEGWRWGQGRGGNQVCYRVGGETEGFDLEERKERKFPN